MLAADEQDVLRQPPSALADVGLSLSACARPFGPPCWGDGVAEHPLGGGCVGQGARRCGDGHQDVLLQGAVAGWVIRGAVLPALPQDTTPGAASSRSMIGTSRYTFTGVAEPSRSLPGR